MKFLLRAVDGSGVPFNADDRGNLENDTAAENGFTLKSHYSPELSPASLQFSYPSLLSFFLSFFFFLLFVSFNVSLFRLLARQLLEHRMTIMMDQSTRFSFRCFQRTAIVSPREILIVRRFDVSLFWSFFLRESEDMTRQIVERILHFVQSFYSMSLNSVCNSAKTRIMNSECSSILLRRLINRGGNSRGWEKRKSRLAKGLTNGKPTK